MSGTLQKVTGFVTRVRPDGARDLLVMQHPTAGIQLPAGTVEEGEPLVDAAFREVAEETGLTELRLLRRLGGESFVCGDRGYAMLRATPLRKGPSASAPILEASFPRGYWCRLVERVGEFSEVVYEELDLNTQPERLIVRYSGWVESDALAAVIERHFFHFEALRPTPERWVQEAEQRFERYWTPLQPRPALVRSQQAWLDALHSELLRS